MAGFFFKNTKADVLKNGYTAFYLIMTVDGNHKSTIKVVVFKTYLI